MQNRSTGTAGLPSARGVGQGWNGNGFWLRPANPCSSGVRALVLPGVYLQDGLIVILLS